jgi:hypothetical protein
MNNQGSPVLFQSFAAECLSEDVLPRPHDKTWEAGHTRQALWRSGPCGGATALLSRTWKLCRILPPDHRIREALLSDVGSQEIVAIEPGDGDEACVGHVRASELYSTICKLLFISHRQYNLLSSNHLELALNAIFSCRQGYVWRVRRCVAFGCADYVLCARLWVYGSRLGFACVAGSWVNNRRDGFSRAETGTPVLCALQQDVERRRDDAKWRLLASSLNLKARFS